MVREGQTELMVPDPGQYTINGLYDPTKAPVFYNPKMEFSRDLAVLVLNAFADTRKKAIAICDPLAAAGARGVRYAKEIGGAGVEKAVLGDLNGEAIPLIAKNAELNGVAGVMEVEHKDANLLLTEHAEPGMRFDVIDIDPFGTPVPFLDAAMRSIKNGGMIAMTATDTAPLCGVHARACQRKYAAVPLRVDFCHEVGLRILIGAAVREAVKYDLAVSVPLSYSTDYYFRAYLKVTLGARRADSSFSSMGHLFHCMCGWRKAVRVREPWPCNCEECGQSPRRAGPLWLGSLVDGEFLKRVDRQDRASLKSRPRIDRLLRLLHLESGMPPTYFVTDTIASAVKRGAPPLSKVLQRLSGLGYSASPTHFHPKAFKTDAPLSAIQQAVREA